MKQIRIKVDELIPKPKQIIAKELEFGKAGKAVVAKAKEE